MNAESEGEKMYLDKWRVAIRNLKNSLFSYPNTAQSCFPDPITDDTVFYCVQGLVYGSQKFPDGKFIRSSPVTSVYSEALHTARAMAPPMFPQPKNPMVFIIIITLPRQVCTA